ncbi:hypothetical protein OQJ26_15535 [Legionella sp. PATHC038]|uniref:hypothetical protein n=1 Tax=Legionella sheltonii TaxID=2992041 RepID=UPI002244D21D|nr:hypothetical protein [Legionella sp. PATHC038]MCW8400196.1 hypothetical protein [Legionella sp. PATHC038]
MPKAFTHLCKKVNLSLYNDTLTVYPKPDLSKSLPLPPVKNELSLLFLLLFSQMDCVSAEVDHFFMERKNELGVYRFVHRDDPDHYLYHQDNFKMDDNHYHAQFSISIDEKKLDSILSTFEKYSIISTDEHTRFIKAYHDANTLPQVTLQTLESTPVAVVPKPVAIVPEPIAANLKPGAAVPKKEYTFGGFKRGFFNSNQESEQSSSVHSITRDNSLSH